MVYEATGLMSREDYTKKVEKPSETKGKTSKIRCNKSRRNIVFNSFSGGNND